MSGNNSDASEAIEDDNTAFREVQTETGSLQANAVEIFADWVNQNRVWIDIFSDHGLILGARDSILEELGN